MNTEAIGAWAGLLWNALNETEAALDKKQIKAATKLKDKEIYAAMGWLARENKLTFTETEDGKDVLVALVK